MTIADGRDAEFLASVKSGTEYLTGLDIRRRGPPIRRDAVRALGLNARTIIGADFYAILNEAGLADPVEAANTLATTFETSLHTFRALTAALRTFGRSARLSICRSNMRPGPCAAASALPDEVTLSEASLIPLEACDRPGNCACRYRALYDFA